MICTLFLKNQVGKIKVDQLDFLVYFKLDFNCLCSLQKSILKLIFTGEKSSLWKLSFQLDFSKFKYRSTGGNRGPTRSLCTSVLESKSLTIFLYCCLSKVTKIFCQVFLSYVSFWCFWKLSCKYIYCHSDCNTFDNLKDKNGTMQHIANKSAPVKRHKIVLSKRLGLGGNLSSFYYFDKESLWNRFANDIFNIHWL